jgi:hypothetical protein
MWVRICTLHNLEALVLRKHRIKRVLPYKRLPIPPPHTFSSIRGEVSVPFPAHLFIYSIFKFLIYYINIITKIF